MAQQAFNKETTDITEPDIHRKPNTFGATTTTLSINSIWQRHWIKIMCCSMLLLTFAGIHQFQTQMSQAQHFASKDKKKLKKKYNLQRYHSMHHFAARLPKPNKASTLPYKA